LKIIYIVHSVSWKGGGVFFHALHLAKGLVKLGHEVTLLSISKKNKYKFKLTSYEGVKIVESPDIFSGQARTGWDVWDTVCRIWYLRNKHFDLVQCFDCRPVVIFPGLFLKYIKRSLLVIEWLDWFGKGGTASERNSFIKFIMLPIETFFEEKFRKYADGSIGLGEPLTERIKEFANSKKFITIYHGSDTKSLKVIDKFEARKRLNLETDAFYIGYTGRMREDVVLRLIIIMKGLKEKKIRKKVYCLLIGNPAFNFERYLSEDIKTMFIPSGWVEYDAINLYMAACDFLTLPFSSESIARNGIWPSKFNDYLSVGRPVLSTRIRVLNGVFEKYKIGIMVDDKPEALISMSYFLLMDGLLCSQMGSNARILAENELNWCSIVKSLIKFYNSIL
jgi:glycosyltransferase involved in cell wall biosynthesis